MEWVLYDSKKKNTLLKSKHLGGNLRKCFARWIKDVGGLTEDPPHMDKLIDLVPHLFPDHNNPAPRRASVHCVGT